MKFDMNSPYYYRSDCIGCKPRPCIPDKCTFDKCKDCMRTASLVIIPKNSVGPCGKQGVIDLTNVNDYKVCEGEVFHKITSYDTTAFESVSIDDTEGIKIYFTTSDKAVPGEHYKITYKASCIDQNIGNFGIIQVFIKDLCAYTKCEQCDPCTGDCTGEVDITTK